MYGAFEFDTKFHVRRIRPEGAGAALAWTWQWVSAALGVTASVLAIVAKLSKPLKVLGDMEVHATAWVLVATVFFGMFGASLHQVIDRWVFAPRRERVSRFQQLKPEVDRVLQNLYRGIRDRPHRSQPAHSSYAENVEMLQLTSALNVRLRAIGVGPTTGLDPEEYLILVDMMERGALREARKRFPLPKCRRWCGARSAS